MLLCNKSIKSVVVVSIRKTTFSTFVTNSKARTLEKQTVSVSITPEIEYYIEDQKIPFEDLENQLIQLLSNEVEPAIVLHADKTVDIEFAVKVMDIAYRNKYKVVLATNPK